MPGPLTTLPEDLLLLCADPADGRLTWPSGLPYALAGAVLAELLDAGGLALDGRRLIALPGVPAAPLPHPALEQARREVATLLGRNGRTGVPRVLRRLHAVGGRRLHLDSLVAHGLVRTDARRVLGFIPVKRYHAVDPGLRNDRLALLDAILRTDGPRLTVQDGRPDLDPHTRACQLTALAGSCALDRSLYPGVGNPIRRRLDEIVRVDPLARAVREAVRAARDTAAAAAGA